MKALNKWIKGLIRTTRFNGGCRNWYCSINRSNNFCIFKPIWAWENFMFFCGYSYWYHLSLVVISEYLFKISVLMKVDLNSRGIDALARFLRFSQRGDNFWDWIPLLLWKEVHSERKDLLLKNKLFPCREEPYDSGCENILTELHSSCVYLDPLRKEYQSCMAVSLVDLICTAISAITFLTTQNEVHTSLYLSVYIKGNGSAS